MPVDRSLDKGASKVLIEFTNDSRLDQIPKPGDKDDLYGKS